VIKKLITTLQRQGQTDRQTDGGTDGQTTCRNNIASRSA